MLYEKVICKMEKIKKSDKVWERRGKQGGQGTPQ